MEMSSPYYFQVQGQMAVTNRLYCDFFVFSFKHGDVCITVEFDEEFWKNVLEKLIWFWKSIVAPELLTQNLKESDELSNILY